MSKVSAQLFEWQIMALRGETATAARTKLECLVISGFAMFQISNIVGPVLMPWLLGGLILVAAFPLKSQAVRVVAVNIFGD